MKTYYPIVKRIMAFIGAAGALTFGSNFVNTHRDDSWRYVEVLPLLIAFALLLPLARADSGQRGATATRRKPPGESGQGDDPRRVCPD